MLKKNLFVGLLSLSLGALASCQSSKVIGSTASFGICAAGSATVRTVTDGKGTMYFDQTLKQYRIHASQAGTVDVVAVGVVCGTLPQALQADGKPVVFSGTYKTHANPPSAPGGTTYYYLELTKLRLQ